MPSLDLGGGDNKQKQLRINQTIDLQFTLETRSFVMPEPVVGLIGQNQRGQFVAFHAGGEKVPETHPGWTSTGSLA